MTQLSPFIIEKFLSANVAPKSVKATHNNALTVEVKNKKYAELLLRTTTLHNMKIKAYSHRSLNTSKGVVRSPELATCIIEEIKQNLKKQLVTDVKRISIKKNDQVVSTSTYILMFNSPKPPPKLKIGYMIAKVDIYIPNPLRCYNCQKFGHHKSQCTRRKMCKNCGMDRSDHQEAICQWLKCVNCQGEHSADSRFCEAWKKEKDIIKIKYTQNISFPKAPKIAMTTYPAWSYSRVTQPIQTTSTSECQKCNLLIRKLASMNPK